ncbi:ABC transporter ATP-binding protein [Roseinatronobacter sp. S2]|uniref:ABC transporter ATP-binding protein n=1 Tax=Roseinatronobacter sp. S2 TaxID=3035471 RepID=UPI00240EAD36|nr:ABC transporter ATP-binding protein [Roseinatronobacter sp. S2]WFE76680.1 ABC transporter ATP-binding protein [Roseinatronobacter sp. S2]
MSHTRAPEPRDPHDDGRARMRAVVGSHRIEEEIFGKAFDGRIVRRLWQFVANYRRDVVIAVIAVVIFTCTQLSIPLLIRYAIDHGMGAGGSGGSTINMPVLSMITTIFAVVILINYVASRLQEQVTGRMAENVLFDIRQKMFAHLQRVSLSFLDKTEVGRLMSRLQGDVNSMQEFLETSVLSVGDILLLLGIVVVMLWLDWQLAILVLSVIPILFLVRVFWLSKARAAFMESHEANSVTNGALAEAINGVRAVQALDRGQLNEQLYQRLVDRNYAAQLRGSRIAQVMVPIVDTLTGLAMAVVVLVGGMMVVRAQIDVGVMVAFLFYIQRFFDPIRSLTMQYSVMQRAMASGHRLTEVLDVAVDVQDAPGATPLTDADDGSVEFRNVTFGYDPAEPVLQDVSFRVGSGQTVALIGPTGSGKSSCMSLIHRFYDIQDGAILVGGRDVRSVTQESLGRHIAMVLQEPYLFTGSVMENIRYSSHWATDDDLVAAAKAVGAHDFIMSLPQGYETQLDERGGNLSLGQRQLVSFARALAADAKILILDEATANIDSYTEMLIQKALQRLLEGRTGLVIAHRLATIRNADSIVVLQQGRLIEEGNHDQLMAENGLYAKLYSLNFASFDDLTSSSGDAPRSVTS